MNAKRETLSSLVLAAILGGVACAPVPPEPLTAEEAARAEAQADPRLIPRVWYGTHGKWFRQGGELWLGAEALTFRAKGKKDLTIPLSEIRSLSYGALKGDVDTEWAVLRVGGPPDTRVVAFRDATKLGYGRRTREIYDRLLTHLEERRAGPYDLPEDLRRYIGPEQTWSTAIPASWHVTDREIVFDDERPSGGTTFFTAEPLLRVAETTSGREEDREALGRLRSGRGAGFWIAREPALRSMGCSGYTRRARASILAELGEEAASQGLRLTSAPTVDAIEVGGCQGLRFRAPAAGPAGAELVVEHVVVTHGGTRYTFGRVVPPEATDGDDAFDSAISRTAFAAAIRRRS